MKFRRQSNYLGDCLEIMKQLPDASVDMVLADLPYGTTQCAWDVVIPFEPLWREYLRIAKPEAAIVLCAAQPFAAMVVASNPKHYRYEWIWEKGNATGFLNAKKQPLRAHESAQVFYRRQPVYNPQMTSGHERKTAKRKTVNSECYGKALALTEYDSQRRQAPGGREGLCTSQAGRRQAFSNECSRRSLDIGSITRGVTDAPKKGSESRSATTDDPQVAKTEKWNGLDGIFLLRNSHVFPGAREGKHLSNMSMLMGLRRMGRTDLTMHGFRSTFRDWAAESTQYPREVCELALAHVRQDKVEAAYFRGDLFEKRQAMMSDWAVFVTQPSGE